MAREDAQLGSMLCNVIIPTAVGIGAVVYVWRKSHSFAERVFAYIYSKWLANGIEQILQPTKLELFAQLTDHESHDRDLKNKGLIRILEIGSGPGTNFSFYPKNSYLVCYDPNPYFRSYLFSRQEDFPDVHLERLVVSGGEDLICTDDGTIDIVVSTLVLCTVQNVDQVLKEIHRVLTPGGKFLFIDHVVFPNGTCNRRLQNLVNPLWRRITLGCNINRDIESAIKRPELFTRVQLKHITLDGLFTIAKMLIGNFIVGTATK